MAKQRTEKPVFNRDQYTRLKQAQRVIHDLMPKLDKAEACGVECQAFRALAQDLSRRLSSFEQHFMPTPPRQ